MSNQDAIGFPFLTSQTTSSARNVEHIVSHSISFHMPPTSGASLSSSLPDEDDFKGPINVFTAHGLPKSIYMRHGNSARYHAIRLNSPDREMFENLCKLPREQIDDLYDIFQAHIAKGFDSSHKILCLPVQQSLQELKGRRACVFLLGCSRRKGWRCFGNRLYCIFTNNLVCTAINYLRMIHMRFASIEQNVSECDIVDNCKGACRDGRANNWISTKLNFRWWQQESMLAPCRHRTSVLGVRWLQEASCVVDMCIHRYLWEFRSDRDFQC